MSRIAFVMILASLGGVAGRFVLPSNSTASTEAGVRQYLAGNYREASQSLSLASDARPGALTDFNSGTAKIAARDRRAGVEALERAARSSDSRLAAAALYNLGTDALKENDTDSAIEKLTQSLRKNPSDRNAKRNLEIALKKQGDQQQQESGGGGGNQDQQQNAPSTSEKPGENDGTDDAMRAIEQQEREELGRMRRAGQRQRRIGW